ncbi:pyridoxal phosphate-dependent transferase [Phlyctochytrium arcticum]|nr:pyridoxal phosphate-dependent transferase [Phlyctochytrium arcticum]
MSVAATSTPQPPSGAQAAEAPADDLYDHEFPFADENVHPSTAARIKEEANYLMQLYARPNIIFSHGKGSFLVDTAGREFLDLNAGIAVNALGHNAPEVTKAIADQAGKLLHLSNLYHNEYAGEFAKALVTSLPQIPSSTLGTGSKVFFCNSGTEANEAALKFGRKYGRRHLKPSEPSNKTTVVSFTNAFHGRSMGALSATPTIKYQTPFLPLLPGFVHAPFNDVQRAKEVIDESVCAVIVEPVQGEGGIYPASQEFLQTLRDRCNEVGALLIFDEIQCGLGRTGKLFAFENYNISPDVVTLAKPLANGIPIGAVIVGPHVAAEIKPGDHGTTFGGSPFATRIGLTVFNKIREPSFLNHVQEMGDYFLEQCKILALNSPLISDVRGLGLMIGLQLREKVDPQMFVDLAREHGILIIAAGNNTVRLVPPLIISKKEIDQAVNAFELVIEEMQSYIASGKGLQ